MDPRHKLYKTLDNLSVNPEHSGAQSATSASAGGIFSSTAMSARTEGEAARVQASSGITPEGIRSKLESELGAIYVEIEDMSGGCGQMFEAVIVSPQFTKKTTLARHRLVNGVLKQEIAAIHAWTPKCHTPEEWERKKPQ